MAGGGLAATGRGPSCHACAGSGASRAGSGRYPASLHPRRTSSPFLTRVSPLFIRPATAVRTFGARRPFSLCPNIHRCRGSRGALRAHGKTLIAARIRPPLLPERVVARWGTLRLTRFDPIRPRCGRWPRGLRRQTLAALRRHHGLRQRCRGRALQRSVGSRLGHGDWRIGGSTLRNGCIHRRRRRRHLRGILRAPISRSGQRWRGRPSTRIGSTLAALGSGRGRRHAAAIRLAAGNNRRGWRRDRRPGHRYRWPGDVRATDATRRYFLTCLARRTLRRTLSASRRRGRFD